MTSTPDSASFARTVGMGASMKTRAPGMSSNAAAHKIRLLRGARAIGDYIGEPPRRVWYIFANKLAPIGREGKSLIADPRLLDEHYQLRRLRCARRPHPFWAQACAVDITAGAVRQEAPPRPAPSCEDDRAAAARGQARWRRPWVIERERPRPQVRKAARDRGT